MRCSFAVRVSALEAAGVPCGPINTLEQVFEDPQVRHREMKATTPHLLAGSVAMVRNPIRLSATPIEYRSPPPTLGQHTGDVLRTLLGMSRDDIARLREQRII